MRSLGEKNQDIPTKLYMFVRFPVSRFHVGMDVGKKETVCDFWS